jgi:glycosyltransferase involved in cell wall biosynthesis
MIDFACLIPVFNTRPAALIEAVSSIANQRINQNFNIVLVDDASTSLETLEAIHFLERNYKNLSVITHAKNEGTSGALNTGHKHIASEYIAIMGSDDVSHQNRFISQVEFLNKNKHIDVLGTNLFCFYDADIYRKPQYISKHPERPTLTNTKGGWLVNHGTVFYKNKSVQDVGGYNPAFKRGQDVELWKRMAQAGKKFANLQDVLYAWRRFK